MEARTDSRLARMRTDVDVSLARIDGNLAKMHKGMTRRDTEAAKHETPLLLAIARMIGLPGAILSTGHIILEHHGPGCCAQREWPEVPARTPRGASRSARQDCLMGPRFA